MTVSYSQVIQSRVLKVDPANVDKFEAAVAKKTKMYNSKEDQPRWVTFQILTGPNAWNYVRMQIAQSPGEFDKVDNPIKNAPHTDLELASNEWNHKYTREEAAYPSEFLKSNKFWPPVARVDNVYGDKNLFCTCPSMDEFKEDAA